MRRSDIFSFGVVLHELLSGKRPFTGATDLEILQKVIHAAPSPLGEDIPPALRGIVEKALEKDAGDRYQSMRELVVDLRRVARGSGGAPSSADAAASLNSPRQPREDAAHIAAPHRTKWLWPAVAALAVAAAAGAWIIRPTGAPAGDSVRLQIPLPPDTGFSVSGGFAISPDGKRLVFSALGADNIARLWLRNLDSTAATPMAGSEHDQRSSFVFWSPDSRKVAFLSGPNLKTLDLVGGSPQVIFSELQRGPAGGSWEPGTILLGNGPGIIRVEEASGKATPVTAVDAAREEVALLNWPAAIRKR